MLLATAVQAVDVTFPGPAGTLAGTLSLPEGQGPFPALLTLTGSGAHFRDGNRTPEHPYRPFREIAEKLRGCGVAVLRVDDRGVGGSTGNAAAASAADTLADAQAAMRFLRPHERIDGARIGAIGHSYGGQIAPMLAVAEPQLAGLVLMGAPAHSFRETMRYQHRWLIDNDPKIAPDDRRSALAAAMAQQARNVAAGREEWRRSTQDLDPLPVLRRVRVPVLILQGDTDRAVNPEDALLIEDTLRDAGNGAVERHLFHDVNHHFQRDPIGARAGYDRLPSQALVPELHETICAWAKRVLDA